LRLRCSARSGFSAATAAAAAAIPQPSTTLRRRKRKNGYCQFDHLEKKKEEEWILSVRPAAGGITREWHLELGACRRRTELSVRPAGEITREWHLEHSRSTTTPGEVADMCWRSHFINLLRAVHYLLPHLNCISPNPPSRPPLMSPPPPAVCPLHPAASPSVGPPQLFFHLDVPAAAQRVERRHLRSARVGFRVSGFRFQQSSRALGTPLGTRGWTRSLFRTLQEPTLLLPWVAFEVLASKPSSQRKAISKARWALSSSLSLTLSLSLALSLSLSLSLSLIVSPPPREESCPPRAPPRPSRRARTPPRDRAAPAERPPQRPPPRVTQRALSVTQRALSVTQRALSVTQRALSVTQRPLRVTQRALSVTQ
jgi:hypothetical protein